MKDNNGIPCLLPNLVTKHIFGFTSLLVVAKQVAHVLIDAMDLVLIQKVSFNKFWIYGKECLTI